MCASHRQDEIADRLRRLADAVEQHVEFRPLDPARSVPRRRQNRPEFRRAGLATAAALSVAATLTLAAVLAGPAGPVLVAPAGSTSSSLTRPAPPLAPPPTLATPPAPATSATRPSPSRLPDPASQQGSEGTPAVPSGRPSAERIRVLVYFPRGAATVDGCRAVFPVARSVPADAPAYHAVVAVLNGPTAAERAQGYFSVFHDDGYLVHSWSLKGDALRLDFSSMTGVDPPGLEKCRSAQVKTPLDATLRQFTWIRTVQYSIAGSVEKFGRYLAPGS